MGSSPRKRITSGSPFEENMAYSRAIVDGRWVFVSGTTGFDYAAMTISSDVAEQAEQCFQNIEAALKRRGRRCLMCCVSLMFCPTLPILRPVAGHAQISWRYTSRSDDDFSGLIDPRMKIEIEVTARKRAA